MKIIGLIPAAGYATRLGSTISGSKELVPIATRTAPSRPVCEYLLLQMRQAGIARALMVIRTDKTDIPRQLQRGGGTGVQLSYITTPPTPGVPQTLDRAYAQVRDAIVVMGFPDILVEEPDCLARLVRTYRTRPVDVLLGLFPLVDGTMDAVEVHERRVRRIVPKPGAITLTHTWAYAMWRASFTEFLHTSLVTCEPAAPEVFIGDILQAAITSGLTVEGVTVSTQAFLDIGTPDALRAAHRRALNPA